MSENNAWAHSPLLTSLLFSIFWRDRIIQAASVTQILTQNVSAALLYKNKVS